MKGYIPERLRVYSRKPEVFCLNEMWGRGWWVLGAHAPVKNVKARKGFAVPEGGWEKTAEDWAKAQPLLTKGLDRFQILFEEGEIYEEIPNAPIKGIRVITLEERGNGGRAYKVVTEEGYCYDLREDVLLEAMIEVGIEKGGILLGSYVWASVGSQMKLIRVDSALHRELSLTTNKRQQKKIGKDLEPGGVYSRASGEKGIFIGWGRRANCKEKLQVWLEVPSYFDEDLQDLLNDTFKKKERGSSLRWTYYLKIVKSSSYVVKEGNVKIPDTYWEELQKYEREEVLSRFQLWQQPQFSHLKHTFREVFQDPENATIVPDGKTPVVDPVIEAILNTP